MPRVAVDLTPLLPGGANGGSRILTLELLDALAREAPSWEWIRISRPPGEEPATGRRVAGLLPSPFARSLARRFRRRHREASEPFHRSRAGRPDLVFSPFSSTTLLGCDVPFVTIVYDLQHEAFPQFFDPALLGQRRIEISEVAAEASGIACISEFVRETFLARTGADGSRVRAIPISLPRRLARPSAEQSATLLARRGLSAGGYLFYPANFWHHKNHPRLLEAFAKVLATNRTPGLRLVLSGEETGAGAEADVATERLGLGAAVLRTGYVDDEEFSALLHDARALVFPSLYEGFGMPVAEALAAGVPVACSGTTSLPEVAGDAALFFDPTSADDISRALVEVATLPPERREAMRAAGLRRVARLGGPTDMARRYLDLFESALAAPRSHSSA